MLTQGCEIAHAVIALQPWRLRLRSRRTCIATIARQFIPKPESSDLFWGLEFDEAVGLKRPNLRRSCRLGLLSPTAVPKRCKPAILNLHERIENKLFLDRTRKDSNFKRPHICATLFQIEKCCVATSSACQAGSLLLRITRPRRWSTAPRPRVT